MQSTEDEINENSEKQTKEEANQSHLANDINKLSDECNILENQIEMSKGQIKTLEEDSSQCDELLITIRNDIEKVKLCKQDLLEKQKNVKNWLFHNDPAKAQSNQVQEQQNCLSLIKNDPQIGWAIYGRLGDLGKIDKTFDKAISAIGNVFDSVLVESDEIAQTCIRILRERKLGQLQFICYNKIQHLEQFIDKPFTAPPQSKRLFDLCSFQFEKAKVAFFFALSNSLVCDKIETARQINNRIPPGQKVKILILDGSILHPNGSIQGGGNAKTGMVNTGEVVQYDNKKMADEYRAELKKSNQLSEAMAMADKDFSKLKSQEADVANKKRAIPQMIHNNKRTIEEKEFELRRKVGLKNQKIQDMQSIASREEFKNFKQIIAKLRKQIAEYTQERDAKQIEIEDLDSQLNLILGNAYAQLVDQIKILEQQREECTDSISKCKSNIALQNKNIKTKTERRSKIQTEIEEAQKELESFNTRQN